MDPILFEIRCPNCTARLAISDPRWIGHVVACPKCAEKILVLDPSISSEGNEPVEIVFSSTEMRPSEISTEILDVIEPFHLQSESKPLDVVAEPNSDHFFGRPPEVVPSEISQAGSNAPPEHNKPTMILPPENIPEFTLENIEPVSEQVTKTAAKIDETLTDPLSEQNKAKSSIPKEEQNAVEKHENGEADPPYLTDGETTEPEEEEREEEEEEEETPFYYRPFFLFSLGLIAALLLVILVALLHRGIPRPADSAQIPPSSQSISPGSTADEEQTEPDQESAEQIEAENPPEELPASDGFDPQGSGEISLTPSEPTDGEQTAKTEEESEKSAEETVLETDPPVSPVPAETTPGEGSEAPLSEPNSTAPEAESKEALPAVPEESDPKNKKESENDGDEFETDRAPGGIPVVPTLSAASAPFSIDVEKQLAIPIESIRFPLKTLPEIIRIATGLSGVPISLDLEAIPNLAATVTKQVGLNMEKTTVGEMLEKAASLFELVTEKEKDRILLTIPETAKNVEADSSFDAADLLSSTAETEEEDPSPILNEAISSGRLLRFLRDLSGIREEENIRAEGGKIVVHGTKAEILSVEMLLERLRHLRHLTPKTELTRDELIPETLAAERLTETMPLHFLEPVPLRDALAVIEESQKIMILFDSSAARAVGVSDETPVRISAENQPIARTLSELLEGLQLTYLPLSENVLLVTSKEEAARHLTVEIALFAIPEGDSPFKDAADAIAQIRSSVDPESWADSGSPDQDHPGRIWADSVSGALIIRQTSLNQSLLRRLLSIRFAREENPAPPDSSDLPREDAPASEIPAEPLNESGSGALPLEKGALEEGTADGTE